MAKEALDEKEQEELKTLQEERKGQHMTDSNRVRLSELLKKSEPAEAKEGGTGGTTAKATPPPATGGSGGSAAPAGKK
jgi:hypothetical protein